MIPSPGSTRNFAKEQLVLCCASGTCTRRAAARPYEFAFSDVNPPVARVGAWRVYKMTGARGSRDAFSSRGCSEVDHQLSPGG